MDYAELGSQLASLRRSQGYSQAWLALHAGVSRVTVNSFETNRSNDVGLRKVLKMFACLGMELATRERSPFPTLDELRTEHAHD
ncbi:MAG: helix-turn-helix transcriptional regulator [Gammaproteobacteria bacterium]|nr:helix-turn-helix transcriptional regulator [Gammaproteobacteria bacterium]